ncbi:MAG: hypothetical protein AAF959_15650 [Cyanobacteria bacterium P01_D01_bin.56]
MSIDNSHNTPSKPTCQHKPGDVWADGCCTSRNTAPQEAKPVDEGTTAPENSSTTDT